MTKFKNSFKLKFLAACASLALALSLTAVPAMAAPVQDGGDTDASVSFEEGGELRLVTAPVISFGNDNAITGLEQNLPAKSIDDNIGVSDLRGNRAGWDLNATLSDFEDENGVTTLQGAYITITNPSVLNPNGNVQDLSPSVPSSAIVLNAGGDAAPVFYAGQNKGMGYWESEWTLAGTVLTVRAGTAVAGESVATINWSFQSAP